MNLKDMLIKENIVKIKNKDEELFKLKSGKKSRLFINVKEASLNPKILNEIKMLVVKLSIEISNINNFDIIGSATIGGVPIASVVSLDYWNRLYLNIPQIIVRSEKVIGNCKDKRVLLIEDVTATGSSIINAVKAIREAGGICKDCIAIVDRQEGAERNCLDNGINLYSLLRKSDFGIDLSED